MTMVSTLNPKTARVLYSVQMQSDAAFHRAIIQEGDGVFSIAKVSPDFKDQPAIYEASFTFTELQDMALAIMAGDRDVAKTKGLGRIFAGGILLTLAAMEITETKKQGEKKDA